MFYKAMSFKRWDSSDWKTDVEILLTRYRNFDVVLVRGRDVKAHVMQTGRHRLIAQSNEWNLFRRLEEPRVAQNVYLRAGN